MRYKDITGNKYGSLLVLKISQRKNKALQKYWYCKCGCGRIVEIRGDNLRSGISTQCSFCNKSSGRESVVIDNV